MRRDPAVVSIALFLVVALLSGCALDDADQDLRSEVLTDLSAGTEVFEPLASAPEAPALFAPDRLSSPLEDRDTALAPDGSLFFFSRMGPRPAILMLEHTASGWSGPTMASFSGLYGDLEPAFTPDGTRLWFASERPAPDGEEHGHDLWWVGVENAEDGIVFGEPQRPGAPLNTEGNEFYPSLTSAGAVYFTTTREGGIGQEDIWVSRPEAEGWSEPQCLGPGVNTPSFEFNAFIAPDESYLLFTRWMREGDFGGGDLYVSFRDEDGNWTEAQNLGAEINTAGLDYCPFVSPDGKTLFFSRKRGRERAEHPTGERLDYEAYMNWALGPGNGAGDIYWVSSAVIDRLRDDPTGE